MNPCPRCGKENVVQNKFCEGCGSSMRPAGGARPNPVPRRAEPVAPRVEPAPPRVMAPQPLPTPPPPPMVIPQVPRMLLTRLDGTPEGEYPLHEGDNLIGREVGGILGQDQTLSKLHATLTWVRGRVALRDEGGRNGTYARLEKKVPVQIEDGDQFYFGRMFLKFEADQGFIGAGPVDVQTIRVGDPIGRLQLLLGRDEDRARFPVEVGPSGLMFGRSRGDMIFPNDDWVSGAHCQITVFHGAVSLVDLGSSNGTYLRFLGTRTIKHGDVLLMGQRLFHFAIP